jgi:hypothetical protein
MRLGAVPLLLMTLVQPALAGSVQVSGKAGYLSEWEVSAEVMEDRARGKREFSGPLTVRHIGVCAPGRKSEMSGEIRLRGRP